MRFVGDRLRQQRKEKGYTQQQMAEQLMVHRTTYTKYELDVVEPSLTILCRIADVLACTTDALLGRE